MKQFYELYEGNEKVSALLTQLSWTNHLMIMSGCKSDEEREFYMLLVIKEHYSSRELERQMDSGYYERYVLSKEKLLPEKIKTEYISKMDFYLEGLDRQAKKPDENPSVGLILCASKNDEVVEYAMSRTMSPMMVSQYQLQLPDKEVLRKNFRNWPISRCLKIEREKKMNDGRTRSGQHSCCPIPDEDATETPFGGKTCYRYS